MKLKLFPFIVLAGALSGLDGQAQVVINELMQSNIDCLWDDSGQFPDSWVELYNAGDERITLGTYQLGLTPDPSQAWSLPNAQIAAHGTTILYCDEENEGRHAPFRLESGKGGSLYLFKDGVVIDQVVNLAKQPAPNIAYGRITDGADQWGYQATPTPNMPNCGRLLTNLLGNPVFSRQGCVLSTGESITLTLSLPEGSPQGTQIRYTLDGSEPTAASAVYTEPVTFDTTTLVRAVLVCDGYLSPRSTTHSYIMLGRRQTLPVVSLVTDDAYIWGERRGILAGGEIEWTPSGNLRVPNFYYPWRRPVNIEYFTQTGAPSVINQLCETRVMGQSSRFFSIKSLVVYANKRFGTKRMRYEFFPQQKPGKTEFKSLVLRNGGNDFKSLYMRDAIIQRTMGMNADIDWQAWQPAMVFINGKYYGMLNVRERSNDHNIETNYGSAVADSIDMVEYWGTEIKAGNPQHWEDFKAFYSQAGHSVAEYAERIDLSEFNNIMAMNFYFNNYDFPGNNCMWWRPTQEGGRWRIIAKDCDFGLGLDDIDYDFPIFEWFYNPGYALQHGINLGAQGSNEWDYTIMFRNMMKNDEYKRLFTDLMAIYMGDFLSNRGAHDVWDPMYVMVKDEIPFYQAAIPDYWEVSNYAAAMAFANQWLEGRANFMYNHLSQFYSLGSPIPLTVNVELSEEQQQAIDLTINDVPLRYHNFDGKMFAKRNVVVRGQSDNLDITGWRVVVTTASGQETETTAQGLEYAFVMPAQGSVRINAIVSSDLCGDLNHDGVVDIADVNIAIDVMLGKESTAADVTGDGTVDIADVNAIINILLGKLQFLK